MSESYARFEDGEDPKFVVVSDKKKSALAVLDTLLIVLGVILILFGISILLTGIFKLKNYSTKDQSKSQILVNRLLWGSLAGAGGVAILNGVLAAITVLFCHKRVLIMRQITAIVMIVGMILLMILNTISVVIRGVQLFKQSGKGYKVKGTIWFSAGFSFIILYHGGVILLLIIRLVSNKLWKK